MSPIRLLISALVLIAAFPFFDPFNVCGSDLDELRERAASMHREVAELIERGHEREAAELREKANAVRQQADRMQDERRDLLSSRMIELLAEKLLDLRNQELNLSEVDEGEERLNDVGAEITGAKRQRDPVSDRPHDSSHQEQPEAARRLKHMRMATEHLERAGLHDEAAHVARRAEETEHRMHRDHRHHGDEHGELARALEEIRNEVRRLRDQVDKLMDQRFIIGREPDRRTKARNAKRDPPRRRTSRQRDPDPEPVEKSGRGPDRQQKEK